MVMLHFGLSLPLGGGGFVVLWGWCCVHMQRSTTSRG